MSFHLLKFLILLTPLDLSRDDKQGVRFLVERVGRLKKGQLSTGQKVYFSGRTKSEDTK